MPTPLERRDAVGRVVRYLWARSLSQLDSVINEREKPSHISGMTKDG